MVRNIDQIEEIYYSIDDSLVGNVLISNTDEKTYAYD